MIKFRNSKGPIEYRTIGSIKDRFLSTLQEDLPLVLRHNQFSVNTEIESLEDRFISSLSEELYMFN